MKPLTFATPTRRAAATPSSPSPRRAQAPEGRQAATVDPAMPKLRSPYAEGLWAKFLGATSLSDALAALGQANILSFPHETNWVQRIAVATWPASGSAAVEATLEANCRQFHQASEGCVEGPVTRRKLFLSLSDGTGAPWERYDHNEINLVLEIEYAGGRQLRYFSPRDFPAMVRAIELATRGRFGARELKAAAGKLLFE